MGGMAAIRRLQENVSLLQRQLSDGTLLRPLLERHEDDIYELQVIQLFEGKASSGEDMRPYYSEDVQPGGYFATKEDAQKYAAWKQSPEFNPFNVQRNPDAPNLYLNGKFHSELGVRFTEDSVMIEPTTPSAREIMAKYGRGQFGLSPAKWQELFNERGVKKAVHKAVRNIINGNSQ